MSAARLTTADRRQVAEILNRRANEIAADFDE